MANKKEVAHLSIFYIKEDAKNEHEIIKLEQCSETFTIPFSGHMNGQLYIKYPIETPPRWTSLFKDVIDINRIKKNTSISAALLLKIEDRYFALTFGHGGRFLLKDEMIEDRFGLLVALNSVDKESFRCIDKQSLDSIESHSRIQSGHETSADQFGLDIEQDMLKAIVGTPKDPSLGNRMTGSDSLTVSVRMDLSDLPELLILYRKKFEQDLNSTDYQWVNNISLVKHSPSLIDELNNQLIEKLNNKDHANLWLSIPEIIDWNYIKGFMYTNGKKIIHPDINLDGFLDTTKNQVITIELLKNRRVYCADEDHNPTFKHWPIIKCIYAEIDHNGNTYILNDTKWYQVDNNFVSKTNKEFKKIDRSVLELPEYMGGGEGKYNSDVAKNNPDTFALLDDKNKIFHGGGHGQVEVCDLFSKEKQLIHIKMYGKSSVLSHLIAQGFVSSQLLQLDSEFRKKVKNKLSKPFSNLINIDKRPSEKEFTVIYSIISDTEGKNIELPFFSRVNMNNTVKILKGFGYNVELHKIHVNKEYAMTKIGKPQTRKKHLKN